MRFRLAFLTLLAGSLGAGAAAAQPVPGGQDRISDGRGGGAPLRMNVRDPVPPMPGPAGSFATSGMADADEKFELSDSERYQLRQQIRDAAEDIYASRRSALRAGDDRPNAAP